MYSCRAPSKAIRDFIAVKAFCGMFDGLPQLPAYPFDALKIGTAFGKAAQPRVAMRPDGKVFYAFGASGNTVQGFDAQSGEAVVELTLAAQPGLTLVASDIVVAAGRLVVAASGADGSAIYQFDPGTHQPAAQPVAIPDLRITQLAVNAAEPDVGYALVKGKGLVRFSPRDFGAEIFANPFAKFNAVGHLVMGAGSAAGFAVATASSGSAETDTYDSLMTIPLAGFANAAGPTTFPLRTPTGAAAQGSDGITLVLPTRGRTRSRLIGGGTTYVVVNAAQAGGTKRLLAIRGGQANAVAEIALPTTGPVALSPSPGHEFLLAAMSEEFQIARVDPATNTFDQALLFPAQMQPTDFAAAPAQKQLLVANKASQTVSMIPVDVLVARPGVDATALRNYRQAMVDAFLALLSRLAQMVKDCVCDHLLVACPECADGDRVVLAAIEIVGGQVKAICAFERREVVTFPKFLYWLSAVPIVPLITYAVEHLCCAQLPQLAQNFFARPGNLVSANTIVSASNNLRAGNLKLASQDALARTSLLTSHVAQAAVRDVLPAPEGTIRLRTSEVINRPAEEVTSDLASSGVVVNRVASYDEALAGNAVQEIGNVPLNVRAGDRVTLFTNPQGQVVFFTRAQTTPQVNVASNVVAPAALRSAATADVSSLRGEVEALRAAHAKELTARDKEIATLRDEMTKMQKQFAEVQTLKRQVAALEKAKK